MLKLNTPPPLRTDGEADDVLDLIGAAKLLRLSDKTTRELAKAGDLPATRLGNQWRFSRRMLLARVRGE
jgi:excisionase family DNA binding protein